MRMLLNSLLIVVFPRFAAPTKMKATLTSSEVWTEIPPIISQLYAPLRFCAKISVIVSNTIAAMAIGSLKRSARSGFAIMKSIPM
jgi:hypothetical protein